MIVDWACSVLKHHYVPSSYRYGYYWVRMLYGHDTRNSQDNGPKFWESEIDEQYVNKWFTSIRNNEIKSDILDYRYSVSYLKKCLRNHRFVSELDFFA